MGYAWDNEPLPSFSIRFSSSHHCCSFSVTHTSHPFIYQYETKVFAKRTSVPLSLKLNVLQCIINIFLSKAQFIYDFSWSCRKWQSSLPLLDGNRNPSLSVFTYSEYVSCKRLQKKKFISLEGIVFILPRPRMAGPTRYSLTLWMLSPMWSYFCLSHTDALVHKFLRVLTKEGNISIRTKELWTRTKNMKASARSDRNTKLIKLPKMQSLKQQTLLLFLKIKQDSCCISSDFSIANGSHFFFFFFKH